MWRRRWLWARTLGRHRWAAAEGGERFGGEALWDSLTRWTEELRIAMFCAGIQTIAELKGFTQFAQKKGDKKVHLALAAPNRE